MARTSDLSFRGAKRRGNLAVHSRITGYSRRNRNCLPEIATGAKRPRNDNSDSLAPLNHCCNTCSCQRRSVSAATDAIGACRFNGGLYGLQVPSRDCTPRALPRASRSGRHVGLRPPRNDKSGPQCHFNASLYWLQVRCREGHAAPLQLSARSVALIIHCRSIFFYCCGSFFPT